SDILGERLKELSDLAIMRGEQVVKKKKEVGEALRIAGTIIGVKPEDLAGGIALYTMEDDPKDRSPYFLLNSALRDQNRTKVKPWVHFKRLLLPASKALPPWPGTQVDRSKKTSGGTEVRKG